MANINNIQQIVQQTLASAQTIAVTKPPKPIFVMRIPATMSPAEVDSIRVGIAKDNITDDYHVLVIPSGVTEFEFELYNADKIERQKWNDVVNKILK